ncbi:hypothetical protein ABMA28_008164 [Loxostege sticticalis]|uniref:BED-type domain-containing protein n=1 Tax=Loxostege sticticalis TaxID=481309 RepID=A0ABD0SG83_LOXSC
MSTSKHKSAIWNHFEISTIDNSKAICLYCKEKVSRGINSKSYNTSNLWLHVKRHHPSELTAASTSNTTIQKTKCDDDNGPQPKKQATLEETISKKTLYSDDDVRAKEITRTIAEEICVDMEPFDLVNQIGFQRLLKKLSPNYKIVSRFHITENVIPEMYVRVKAKVLELLKELSQNVTTTDIWTSDSSSQSNDFLSLTAHGINANFEYKNYCLEVMPFDGAQHSGINISSNLNTAFQDWGIQDRVRAVVTDNAPNMSLAIREIQKTYDVLPVKCLAHSLQLIIKASLFKDDMVNEMITKARSVIGHFSHSTSSSKILKEMQDALNIPNHVLIQDITTRWDSTLVALRRLLEQRIAVQACLPRIKCKVELTTEEWVMMEEVVNILRYFEEATKSISKDTATLSDAIPLINSLRKLLNNIRSPSTERRNSSQSQKLATDLLLALNEKFDGLENEETYCLATMLDPRYKARIFQLQSTINMAKKRLVELLDVNLALHSETISDTVTSTPRIATVSSEMPTSGGLWSVCEDIIKESEEDEPLSTLSCNSLKEEVERYLRSPNISRDEDPFVFWRNDVLYPNLKKIAQKYFSFQMSSVASERLFSSAGLIQTDLRNRLSPQKLRLLCFLNKNLINVNFNY